MKELKNLIIFNEDNYKEKYLNLLRKHCNDIYIYGMGEVAGRVIQVLKDNNIDFDGFIIDDIYADVVKKNDKKVVLWSQLSEIGEVDVILGLLDYPRAHHKLEKIQSVKNIIAFNRVYGTEDITNSYFREHYDSFVQTFSWLEDEWSKKTFINYLASNINYNPKDMYAVYDRGKQYFSCQNLIFKEEEVFVNCGAYTGDTLEKYFERVNWSYKKIYAFEPDEQNYQKLINNIKEEGIEFINKGVYSHSKGVSFVPSTDSQISSGMSRVAEDGKEIILTDTIDNVLSGDKVTFINMDIEGAELEALRGAEKSIEKWNPQAAISIYHKAEDLITIPQFFKSVDSKYKFYLRSYCPWCEEVVLYAVIEDR